MVISTLEFAMEFLLVFKRIAKWSNFGDLKKNNDATYFQLNSSSYLNVFFTSVSNNFSFGEVNTKILKQISFNETPNPISL